MEYQVIARKWRPQTFRDVVGQDHITRTLTNAVTQGRTAHAYLFVGPRGIGKTSSARIFAKALNCLSPVNGEPCCQCVSCESISAGNCMDIIEIDAASNNSVSSMRDLCDEVLYAPVSCKYKIYIIDEVHMLTAASWNALLKTVEEPPEHVKFIFATTEVHKVLPTILSRCQRFDLRRIPSSLICERLRIICDTEQVPISDGALNAIARAADGGMRDAQSLLDQMISFYSASEDVQISEDQVLSLFGLTASVEMETLIHAIIVDDKGSMISNIYQLANKGKDLEKLLEEVMTFLRGIQICQILPDPTTVIESGAESVTQYQRLAQSARPGSVQRLLEVLSPVGYTLHSALNKQVYLETIILKAMRIAHAAQVDDVIARLNQIRKNGELEVLDRVPATPMHAQPTVAQHTQPVVSAPAPQPLQPATAARVPQQMQPVVAAPVPQQAQPVVSTQVPQQIQPVVAAPVPQQAQPVVSTQVPQQIQPVVAAPVPQQAQPVVSTPVPQQIQPVVAAPVPTIPVQAPPVAQFSAPTQPVVPELVQQEVSAPADVPPWKVEEQSGSAAPVATAAPQLIENFSRSDEYGAMPLVESVEQQMAVREPVAAPRVVASPIDISSSIPSPNSIETRDNSNDNVNPFAVPLSEEVDAACGTCVEENTIFSPANEEEIVPETGTLTAYPGDTSYQEPHTEADIPEVAYIDFDSIGEPQEGNGHFDEVAHMEQLKQTALSNPLVNATLQMFSGKIVDVHPAINPQGV